MNARPAPRRATAATPPDADTEARILEAARTVFIRRGTAGARLHEIAAEAGVTQALIHYYFGSKDALAERVFRESAARMLPVMARLQLEDHTLESLVAAFVTGYIDVVRHAPFIPGYLLTETQHHPERLHTLMRSVMGAGPTELAPFVLARVEAVLRPAIAAGTVRPIAPAQLLINVIALTVFPFVARPILATALHLEGESFERFLDERRETLPRFILDALRP
ncbi:MAG: TetR/AcrR family transcriptional regulator [Gemmatimonadaceae bacterium]|jgi:AcrR family transcriptional regulator|nr:TetR/AcrR family transcriptional regulator [Gemmatimonadaceae bacterium]